MWRFSIATKQQIAGFPTIVHLVKQVFPYEVGDGEILSYYASVPCLWMLSFAKSPSDSVAPAV